MADFPDSTPMPEISRPVVEAEIERLIDLLDTLDPDPDLESSADEEPWLGAPDARTGSWFGSYATDPGDDREQDTGDDEPWLGAANPNWNYYTPSVELMINKHLRPHLWAGCQTERTRETSQSSWCSNGCSDDREMEFDNEPDRDGEGTSNYAGPCSPTDKLLSPTLTR